MFQFTREFIINDNEGKINGQRFGYNSKAGVFMVDRICNLYGKNVVSAWKSTPQDAEPEVVEFTPALPTNSTLATNDVVRLTITLAHEGRVISTYNDNYPGEHTRTFLYEAKVATANTIPVAGLVAAYENELKVGGEAFFTLEENGGKLTFTAPDEYTRVREISIVKVPSNVWPNLSAAMLTGYLDYETLVYLKRRGDKFVDKDGKAVSGVNLTPGKVGVGTTDYILNNMRLRTAANITPYGINMDERPLPKSKYTQYTIEYVTERRHIGGQVFGSIDHSLATYIFFVLSNGSDACSQDLTGEFEDALKNAGIEVCEVNSKFDDTSDNTMESDPKNAGNTTVADVINPTVVPVEDTKTKADKKSSTTQP